MASNGLVNHPWWYVSVHVRRNLTWMFSAAKVEMMVLAICQPVDEKTTRSAPSAGSISGSIESMK